MTADPAPRLFLRIDLPNGQRIGPGKIAVLEAVAETGSISAAARKLGMSYRRAWLLVEAIGEALGKPAVETHTGGSSRGGAVLTDAGRALVAGYRTLETRCQAEAPAALKEVFSTG